MDKRINLALVGFGKFGKKYFKNIKKNNNFDLKSIFRKKKTNNKRFNILTEQTFKKYNYDAGIICTPVRSHYLISKLFIKNNIPIILEKPAADSIKQIKKLIEISNKKKISVIINHSDLYNENFKFLLKNKSSIGKINFIEANFGKYSLAYKDKSLLPYKDWLPHPLALIFQFVKKINSIDIIAHRIIKKKDSFFQTLEVSLKTSNKIDIKIIISNQKKKARKLTIYGNQGLLNYDGYIQKNNFILSNKKTFLKKKHFTPMENILKKLYTVSKIGIFYSDLNLSLKIEDVMFKIKKKL